MSFADGRFQRIGVTAWLGNRGDEALQHERGRGNDCRR